MTINPQLGLAASTVHHQKLLDRIPSLAWLMTDQGELLTVNQRWHEYLGRCRRSNEDELLASSTPSQLGRFIDILPNQEHQQFLQRWEDARKYQKFLEIKLQLQSSLGNWEWFKVELEPDSDELGQPIWIGTAICFSSQISQLQQAEAARTYDELQADEQGNARQSSLVYDIADRQQDNEALYRSGEFTRRLLASNQDCIKVLDLEGRLLYMSDSGQALLEVDDFATIAQNHWLEFWQGSETELAKEALMIAKAGGIGKFEGYCTTSRGTPKWWEVIVSSIPDAKGNIEQILSVSRDITERKKAAIALQISEELFRNTFEQTAMGFAHVSLDGTWLRVNQKTCDIVGYSKTQLLATTFQAITDPTDLAADLTLVEKLLKGEIAEYTLEKRYIHRQGHQVWVNLTVSLIRKTDPDVPMGTPQYFISAIEDITERKQLEILNQDQTTDLQYLNNALMLTQQRLQERNEELDNFVHVASHDLKAPLRSIANLSEWIEDDLGSEIPADSQKQFQLLRQRVNRMDALIDGLLHYSRIGRQQLRIETVDVAKLLAEILDSLTPPAGFSIEVLSPLPTLETKRILLNQVFTNLLSNAIKHHHQPTGRIEVTAEDLGDCYRFSITDDGPGIPAGESQKRIFEIFQTLNPSVSSKNTGIGLALVKKIVEGEGGQIWLDENAPSGARFCFTWLKIS